MPGRGATVAGGAALLFVILIFLGAQSSHIHSRWRFGHEPWDHTGHYPYVRPTPFPWHPPSPQKEQQNPTTRADKVIVMVKLEHEDASWVEKDFPDWQNQIIPLDNSYANLHQGGKRADKGRIANAYLTYIIENYNNLPSTLVFLGPSQRGYQPHSFSARKTLSRLQIPFVQKTGFANLRCTSAPSCQDAILPFRSPPNEFRTLEVALPKAWQDLFNNTNVPERLATPCCAEFAVSRNQLKKRTVDDYLRFWTWLNRTKMDDDTAGLVFEYLWHVIFGREAVFCPGRTRCECDVYGLCGRVG